MRRRGGKVNGVNARWKGGSTAHGTRSANWVAEREGREDLSGQGLEPGVWPGRRADTMGLRPAKIRRGWERARACCAFQPRIAFGWISAFERVCSQARALALSNFGNISSSPTCIACQSWDAAFCDLNMYCLFAQSLNCSYCQPAWAGHSKLAIFVIFSACSEPGCLPGTARGAGTAVVRYGGHLALAMSC